MTIYKSDEYGKRNSILKIQTTDKNGNVSDSLINTNDIDPQNATQDEILALNAYLVNTGKLDNSVYTSSFLLDANTGTLNFDDAQIKHGFFASTKELMNMQKRAGNIEVYYKLEKILELYSTLKLENLTSIS